MARLSPDRYLCLDVGERRIGVALTDPTGMLALPLETIAVTRSRIIEPLGNPVAASLIECWLETGRTHQIRVHMAHRHYPLIGDPVYGGRPRIPKGASDVLVDALRGFRRQALHAQALGLLHPQTGEKMQFECTLPEDMHDLLAVLQQEDPPIAHDTTLY